MFWWQKTTKSTCLIQYLPWLTVMLLMAVEANASSFVDCEVKARMINVLDSNKSMKLRDGNDAKGVQITVQLIDTPTKCTGHGSKYKGNEQLEISATLVGFVKAEQLIPQSIVTLNYYIFDSLTPKGAVEGEFWKLLLINQTPL